MFKPVVLSLLVKLGVHEEFHEPYNSCRLAMEQTSAPAVPAATVAPAATAATVAPASTAPTTAPAAKAQTQVPGPQETLWIQICLANAQRNLRAAVQGRNH